MKSILAAAALAIAIPPAFGQQSAPPWNIGGDDWICIVQCAPGKAGKPVRVVQEGARFVLFNESGTRSDAEWKGEGQISFIGCDNNAILSADLKRLDFAFGSVWVR